MIGTRQAADNEGVSESRIRQLCRANRIPGAEFVSGVWTLPDNFNVIEADRKRPGKISMVKGKKK